ncbi:MAG: sigma-54-dependent Fis family transcriptional regulator [Nitrospirae bacterium]|nr:MAG: sigma-54-dependent Fis family transcriptional regulator [Nitrospirota bacterium]
MTIPSPMPLRILVMDDEELIRLVLKESLQAEGCAVTTVTDGRAGLDALQASPFDCVITDLRMPRVTGWEVLRWVREHQPDVDVIVLTGHGEVPSAVEAIKAGACDYVVKETPFNEGPVKAALAKLLAVRTLRQENLALKLAARMPGLEPMVPGISPAWKKLMETVEKVAPSNAPVLIQGETGSGKEVVAGTLHQLSPRREAPFLAVNCGAVSGQLLESELFGHEKGAFTGAATAKSGLFAAAEGGTLFLDEISEMSGPMQVSLLRVLDRGEYRQVGGTRTLRANVRVVAASNRSLQDMVQSGRFRDDLLYRINTVTISVPPLRERPEDLPRLAEHFLGQLHVPGKVKRTVSSEALARLSAYPWPGNVRELRNVIERLILLSAPGRVEPIGTEELASVLQPMPASPGSAEHETHGSLESAEQAHILRVLQAQEGNKTQAARVLRIDYKTLLSKLRKYGLES